ncbi:MAG: hypothetical protein ACRDSZ_21480 [Pseudonocardiaceae bacterium]
MSTARWTGRLGSLDRVDDPADGLGPGGRDPAAASAEGVTAEGIITDAMGGESDTSGATSIGSISTSIRRCTVDGSAPVGPAPVGAAAVGSGVVAVTSAEGDHTGRGPGCRGVSTARWMARPGTVDGVDDPADGLGPAELDPVTGVVEGGTAEGIATDAIGGVSDTNGATCIGSPSTSIRRCTVDGSPPV